MSLGTLAINNNSDQVAGTGTSFTVDLKVNDFIAVPSGGVTYTMVVKAIASDTALTITRPFSGPNVTGANWAAIPAGTMVGVTAKIADDTAYTMRMYVNEANNWMSLLTIDGDVTVYAPDGSDYTGPSWLKLSRIMGTLDMPTLTTIAAQIHADAVQVAADTQTTTTNTATATQAAQTATTAAQSASQAAQTATTKAGEASASAVTAKNEADRAATANPDNQLKKVNNLSDVDSIPQAQINLKLDRYNQATNETYILSPDKLKHLTITDDSWGFWDVITQNFIPLGIAQGGTGAKTAADALSNLGLTTALANKQPLDATLTALAGLVNGANKLPYFTGADTMGVADLSEFVRPMLGKDDATAILSYLGLGQASTTKSGIVKLSSRADSTSETEAATPKAISDLHAVIDVLLPKRVFAENDYIRIPDQPGGLILQWGTSTTALKNNFPIPFTNACLKVFQIPQSSDAGPHGLVYHQVISTDRFSFTRPAIGLSIACFYFAIGY